MGIKLVVTDLDGTLLDRDHTISAANKAAICAAVEQKITVTIATGRMYASALPYAKQLGVDVPIITYNGALIKSVAGEVFFEQYLEPAVVTELAKFCRQRGWYLQLYHDDVLYFAEHNVKAQSYEQLAGVKGIAIGERLYTLQNRIPKLLIITDSSAQSDAWVEVLRTQFRTRLFATKSNPTYIEIVHPAVNKAAALAILMKKLYLSPAQVLAIGDSNNDVPMLEYAGTSVAMGNATAKIKTLCDYVTADCTQSGVAAAIEKYVLKKQ